MDTNLYTSPFAASHSPRSVHYAKGFSYFFNARWGLWRCDGSWTLRRQCLDSISCMHNCLNVLNNPSLLNPTFWLSQSLFYTPLSNITRNYSGFVLKKAKSFISINTNNSLVQTLESNILYFWTCIIFSHINILWAVLIFYYYDSKNILPLHIKYYQDELFFWIIYKLLLI